MGNGNHQLETWKDCVDARRIKQQEGKNISFPSCRIEPTVNVFPSWLLPGCWLLLSLEGFSPLPPFLSPTPPHLFFLSFPLASTSDRSERRGRGEGWRSGRRRPAFKGRGRGRERVPRDTTDRENRSLPFYSPPPSFSLASPRGTVGGWGPVRCLPVGLWMNSASLPPRRPTPPICFFSWLHTHTRGGRGVTPIRVGPKKDQKGKKKEGERFSGVRYIYIDCYFSPLFRRGCLCK